MEQKTIRPGGMASMYGGFYGARMTNVLCSDGKRRVATFTSEPDTMFTQPSRVKVNGVTVTGHIYYDSMYEQDGEEGIWKFTAYTYRKNHAMLPEWDKES